MGMLVENCVARQSRKSRKYTLVGLLCIKLKYLQTGYLVSETSPNLSEQQLLVQHLL